MNVDFIIDSFRSLAVEYINAPDFEPKSVNCEFFIIIESTLIASITPPISVAEIDLITLF